MSLENFHVYLNNSVSIKKHPGNTPSEFVCDIVPPIVLPEPNLWEVCLTSAIIPFDAYRIDTELTNKNFTLIWGIQQESDSQSIKHYEVKISYLSLLRTGGTVKDIYKKILSQSSRVTRQEERFF